MKPKVFIDGEHGTTGLQIRQRLARRDDLQILSLEMEDRRDNSKRSAMLNEADLAILCLPDDAARESVSMLSEVGNNSTKVVDTSTAHRSDDSWAYGFAEMAKGHSDTIARAMRVSNPGCYSTGAIALIKPLVEAGLLPEDYPITINGISGYSGGGKQLIARMENQQNEQHIETSCHQYALGLKHKHVPEIIKRCGLQRRPIFTPVVGRFAQGMLVSVPLHLDLMTGASAPRVEQALRDHYSGQDIVEVVESSSWQTMEYIAPEALNGQDIMRLYVTGGGDTGHINLVAQLDNLGKGASGAAVQNMDLMLH